MSASTQPARWARCPAMAMNAPGMRYTPESFEVFGRLTTAIFSMTSLNGSRAWGANVWVRLSGGFAVSRAGGPHPE